MSKLDEYTTRLLKLFHTKGGAMGLKLRTVLQKVSVVLLNYWFLFYLSLNLQDIRNYKNMRRALYK